MKKCNRHVIDLGYDRCDMKRGRRLSQCFNTPQTSEMYRACSEVHYEQPSVMKQSFVAQLPCEEYIGIGY